MAKHGQEKHRSRQPTLPRLFDLWRLFFTHTSSEDLMQQLVQELAEALKADRVSLMLLNDNGEVLTICAAVGLTPDVVRGARVRLGEGIVGWVGLTGQPLLLPEGPGVPGALKEAMVREEVTSALCVPLQVEDRVIGVLNLTRLSGRSRFTLQDLAFVSVLAERAAIAIRVTQLRSELRAGEEFVSRILESIPTSLLVLDRTMRIVSANRNFLEKTRRTHGVTLGRKVNEVLPRALLKRTQLERMAEEVFRTGSPVEGGRLAYRAPGLPTRFYFYRLFPIKTQKTVENVVLLMDDITERERLQEEVRRAERHLASVVECATDLVVSLSLDGCIISWNQAAETVSGFLQIEAQGRTLSSLCPESHRQRMDELVQRIARGEKVQTAELSLLTRDGREVPIAWSSAPLQDDLGNVVGVVAVGRDLTERRRMEAELLQSSKVASLGVMAGGIAHELRNPLGTISAALQVLTDHPDDSKLRNEALHKIYGAVQRASLTIENLLKFGRPSPEREEDVEITALIDETLALLASQIAQRVSVRRDFGPPPLLVRGNRHLLQQVFINVILNACNAMPERGTLTVATRANLPDQVEIRFTDTGHGIRPEHLSRVFDPFFSTRPAGQGTGLGLAISSSIVRRHSGSMGVESEVGKGTTFVVRLPSASLAPQPQLAAVMAVMEEGTQEDSGGVHPPGG